MPARRPPILAEVIVVSRHIVLAAAGVAGLLSVSPAAAQIADEFSLPRAANCCLLNTAVTLAEQLQDWNQLGRYHAANQELLAEPPVAGRVVYIGDSITDGWPLAESFPGEPYVNRGISGQTTAQMLVRFYPDVLALNPDAVVIFAGTNDIARNNGPQTIQMIQHNIMAMVELAQAHDVKVVLAGIMPINDRTTLPMGRGASDQAPRVRIQSVTRPPADILALNRWLESYAAERGAVYADFHTATVDAEGFLRDGITNDGLHPNAQGYALMAPVVSEAIERALR